MRAYISYNNKNGFTLVETLVAISILLLIVIGPLTSAQKGIQNAYYAKEQVTAVYLAQEAIEAVRQLRDDEALGVYSGFNTGTADWVPSGCGSGCGYEADNTDSDTNGTFSACSNYSGGTCLLKVNAGKYMHSGGTNSQFTRVVTFGAPTNGGVLVTVEVSWTAKVFGGQRSVKLQTWLYDHYSRFQ